ncbi:hypothetical protein B566_EDAN015439 [Ephemera danica]|nr:hypothetical protein B566_EDAN015439 [Ephemera danica]
MAALQARRQEVLSQLEKVVGRSFSETPSPVSMLRGYPMPGQMDTGNLPFSIWDSSRGLTSSNPMVPPRIRIRRMPIQAPQWTDFLSCPVCCNEFDAGARGPHLSQDEALSYRAAKKCIEELALYLKPFSGGGGSSVLSRPMQRKLVTLINCQLLEEEGRARAMRAARSLGERSVTELILHHQNPQQLSANLWAAVRARGCQFLGPAMQEEVLRLVLLALEDGSALSRKVLVMFVVQRLEPHFPQASKTSIGHVVQLLYRASCFKVSKREGDSSLMQLKEEFRAYEALRREHDAQIVQIATEAGLRIAPDQWSSLLYGDAAHKSHMQSIMDKLQTPQSFAQSVQELMIALQRSGDPGGHLGGLRPSLELLAAIDPCCSPAGSGDGASGSGVSDNGAPGWSEVASALEAARAVGAGLVRFLAQHGAGAASRGGRLPNEPGVACAGTRYKVSMCRDLALRAACPRGANCTFAHSEEELESMPGEDGDLDSASKFGPISPVVRRPPQLAPSPTYPDLPMTSLHRPSSSTAPWYTHHGIHQQQQQQQSGMAHMSPEAPLCMPGFLDASQPLGSAYCGPETGLGASDLLEESRRMQQQLRTLEKKINDLKLATQGAAISEGERLAHELRLIEHGILERERELQMEEEEESYERGLADDMRELALRWESELEEQEKRWSSEEEPSPHRH